MAQTFIKTYKAEVRGTAVGVLFMAFFGTMWAYLGIMGLQGWGSPWLLIAALTIGIVLVIGGSLLIFASRVLPNKSPNVDEGPRKNIGIWFNIIFAAEGVAIVIAIAVCNAMSHAELIPPVIAMIVGIHFLPLANLFQVKTYYVTGILLSILPIITILFVPLNLPLNDHQINAYMSVVGFGSALILWGTSLVIWLMGKRLIDNSSTCHGINSQHDNT